MTFFFSASADDGTLGEVVSDLEDTWRSSVSEESRMQKRKTDQVTVSDLPFMDLVTSTKAAGNGGSSEKKDGEEASKVPDMVSPIRVQRKKLLILDLNGLLADINQHYRNSHLSHGKVRGKLGKSINLHV